MQTSTRSSPPDALLEAAFEHAGAALCLVAPDGTALRANVAWLRSTGRTREEPGGADLLALFPEVRAIAARVRAGETVALPRRVQRLGGADVWWEGRVSPVPLAGGTALLVSALDVSADVARQRAEEGLHASEARFRQLANAMPHIVCVLAPDGTPEYVNPGWIAYSGLDLAATQAAGWRGVLHPDDLEAAAAGRLRLLRTLAPQEVELRYRAADGTYRWFLSRIAPVVEGRRVVRAVGSAMEIEDRKRATEALRASEERFRLVNEATHDVIWDWDVATGELVWNGALEPTFGYALAEVPPEADWWSERIHPEERERVTRGLHAAVADPARRSWSAEYRFRRGDGSWAHVLDRGYVARAADGRAVRMIGSMLELTDRKLAEEALRRTEEQLRNLADTMPQLVWTSRPDGSPEYYNRQWSEFTGATLDDPSGDAWSRIVHPEDRARTVARWRRSVATGEPYDAEYRIRDARDGSYRWFLARALPVRDAAGPIARWFGTCTDIDERKRFEAELLTADRAVRASEQLLREEHRRKDEFLGMLSHELRNPLAPIRNSVFVLRHGGPAKAEGALQVIERQTTHLTRLVDDLLDVTRIARGKVQLRRERLDVGEVVRRTGEDFRPVFEDRGIALRVVLPVERVWVDADATRLAQVLGNLLHNAAKFTVRGDEVTASVEVAAGEATIRVRDTGAGIDPALLPTVFDAFVQADRTLARTEGGLGLGLALVKGIVELHGGRVSAASAGIDQGAEFTSVLPLAAAPAAREPGPGAAARAAGGRRVLIVDDNRDAADSLAQLVGAFGHETEVAYDAESAIATARAKRPDVVLCDLGLPVVDGYEVARRIRAFAGTPVRLVAVSGYAQPEDVARALHAGFDAHVAKPADPAHLEALLA